MLTTKYRWLIGVSVVVTIALAAVGAYMFLTRPTVVPDLSLKPVADAPALLKSAGLSLGESGQVATSAVGPGLIALQRPGALAGARRRSSVDVSVAVTPVSAEVPYVMQLDSAHAVRALTVALYMPVTVDIFLRDTPPGVVVDQVPSAGKSWTTGRTVALGVAAGPDDGSGVGVPDLMGKRVNAALSKLEESGLRSLGFVTQVDTPATNIVVDQLPEAGVIVRPGTTVLLLFEAP